MQIRLPPPPKRSRRKNKTSEDVFIIYEITCLITNEKYVGFTASIGKRGHKAAIKRRFTSHISSSKNSNLILYVTMRKYGIENFKIEIKKVFSDPNLAGVHIQKQAHTYELELIKSGEYVLNSSHRHLL